MNKLVWLWLVFVGACATRTVSGGGLLLNVQPNPPSFSSSYDFDLLEPATGHACVQREGSGEGESFWVSLPGYVPTQDGPTNQAIGAAAFRAISGLDGADTLLVMRVVTRGEPNLACATVYGRGVKVRKSGVASPDTASAVSDDRRDIPTLDRDLIAVTVQSVMSEIRQCATFDHGVVKLAVVVAPNGMISSVNVVSAPKGELGECVAAELKKVVFPPSKNGATFTYPFNL